MKTSIYSGIKYPHDPVAILAHKALGGAFRTYAKRALILENVHFLDARFNPKKNFALFFKAGAKWELNLKSDTMEEARQLGEKSDWKNRKWKTIHQDAAEEISGMIERDSAPRFYGPSIDDAAREFRAVHLANLKRSFKLSPKAAKVLGITDTKTLREVAIELQMKNFAAANRLADKLMTKTAPKKDKASFLKKLAALV